MPSPEIEVTCISCHGTGRSRVPHAALDSQGRPMIEIVDSACITCAGNGRVKL